MRRLRTVHGLLQEANGLGLLADPLMEKATAEIVAGSRPRSDIQRDIKQKERARDMLVRRYKTSLLAEVGSLHGLQCQARTLTLPRCGLHRVISGLTQRLLTCERAASSTRLCLCSALLAAESMQDTSTLSRLFLTALQQCAGCAGGHLAMSVLPLGQQLVPALQQRSCGPHDRVPACILPTRLC